MRQEDPRADRARSARSSSPAASATGYGADLGTSWFDIIEPFADYAFNKSHAYGYGLVAYQTAYLKANYPIEYLACLLTSVKANLDKAAVYLAECRSHGHCRCWCPTSTVSAVGLRRRGRSTLDGAPPAAGVDPVRAVGGAQRRRGPRRPDRRASATRTDPSPTSTTSATGSTSNVLNKRTIESLIKAGGLRLAGSPAPGPARRCYEQIVDRTVARRRKEAEGQFELFGAAESAATAPSTTPHRDPRPRVRQAPAPRLREGDARALRQRPSRCMGAEASLRRKHRLHRSPTSRTRRTAPCAIVGGVITGLQRKWTKKGDLMAVFQLEDLQTSIEVMVFPKTMPTFGHMLSRRRRRDRARAASTSATRPAEAHGHGARACSRPIADGAPPLRLKLPARRLSEDAHRRRSSGCCSEHPGDSQVFLHLGEGKVLRLPDEFCVDLAAGGRRAARGLRPRRRRALTAAPAALASGGEWEDSCRRWQNGSRARRPARAASPASPVLNGRRPEHPRGQSGHGDPGRDEGLHGTHRRGARRDGRHVAPSWWRGLRDRPAVEGEGGLGARRQRPRSTASSRASPSPPSSASAARPACCSGWSPSSAPPSATPC